MRELFKIYPWDLYDKIKDPEAHWNFIKTAINMMLNQEAVVKTKILKKEKIPWYNSSLVSLPKKRSMAYNKAQSSGLTDDWLKFTQYRNRYKKC